MGAGNDDQHQDQGADQDQAPGEDESTRIEGLDERFGRLEQEQREQRGLLEQLLAGKGPAKGAHDAAQQRTQHRLEQGPAASIADQVRQAVKDVNAEAAQQQAEADHAAEHQRMREAAERPPRERAGGLRGRLQTVMFGRDQ